jgi:hypothetical protein
MTAFTTVSFTRGPGCATVIAISTE